MNMTKTERFAVSVCFTACLVFLSWLGYAVYMVPSMLLILIPGLLMSWAIAYLLAGGSRWKERRKPWWFPGPD